MKKTTKTPDPRQLARNAVRKWFNGLVESSEADPERIHLWRAHAGRRHLSGSGGRGGG